MQRNVQPPIKDFEDIEFQMPRLERTRRGIPIYIYDNNSLDVCRVDIVFFNGTYEQDAPLIAQAAAEAATEASAKKSSKRVADIIDFYGGWVRKSVSSHYTMFTLYSTKSKFNNLLPIFLEVITSPRFSNRDLNRFKREGSESLKVAEKRVDAISLKIFKHAMFGSHPYGVTPKVEDYHNLNTEQIREYCKKWYVAENCGIFLAGAVSDDMIKLLCENSEQIPASTELVRKKIECNRGCHENYIFERVEKALQSSVRIGARTINRDNENYIKLHILNSALGGYFGSRLNKNIREEKGYTYGINSWLIGSPDAAYITILSQTATNFTKPLINEVKNEIDKIKQSPIPLDELQSLKGYLLGDIARMFDTCFSLTDNFIAIITNNLPYDYFNQRAEIIESITPQTLLETAQNYLPNFEDMITVVAGDL